MLVKSPGISFTNNKITLFALWTSHLHIILRIIFVTSISIFLHKRLKKYFNNKKKKNNNNNNNSKQIACLTQASVSNSKGLTITVQSILHNFAQVDRFNKRNANSFIENYAYMFGLHRFCSLNFIFIFHIIRGI